MTKDQLHADLLATYTGVLSPASMTASAYATHALFEHNPRPTQRDISVAIAVAVEGVLGALNNVAAERAGLLELANAKVGGHG